MKQFSIYIKPTSFYWTRTLIIYILWILIIFAIFLLKVLIDIPNSHKALDFLLYISYGLIFYSGFCAFLGMVKYKPIRGELNGFITFSQDTVTIAAREFAIDDIKKIEFQGVDWHGLYEYNGPAEYFENRLSQGVKNTLILYLNNGKIIKTQFQKLQACDLKEIEDVIICYYLKGKISYLQTVDNLCYSNPSEWEYLKKLKQS